MSNKNGLKKGNNWWEFVPKYLFKTAWISQNFKSY
jgi:hypothetical protein